MRATPPTNNNEGNNTNKNDCDSNASKYCRREAAPGARAGARRVSLKREQIQAAGAGQGARVATVLRIGNIERARAVTVHMINLEIVRKRAPRLAEVRARAIGVVAALEVEGKRAHTAAKGAINAQNNIRAVSSRCCCRGCRCRADAATDKDAATIVQLGVARRAVVENVGRRIHGVEEQRAIAFGGDLGRRQCELAGENATGLSYHMEELRVRRDDKGGARCGHVKEERVCLE